MPVGCDFVCENEACSCFGSGFTMHDLWPISSIADILSNPPEHGFPEGFVEAMTQRMSDGRKFGVVFYPLAEGIGLKGVRVQLWQSDPPTLVDEDVEIDGLAKLISENGPSAMVEAVSNAGYTKQRDGKELKTFRQCFQDGIPCPHCGEPLAKKHWAVSHR